MHLVAWLYLGGSIAGTKEDSYGPFTMYLQNSIWCTVGASVCLMNHWTNEGQLPQVTRDGESGQRLHKDQMFNFFGLHGAGPGYLSLSVELVLDAPLA